MARPLRSRLRFDLSQVRQELVATVTPISDLDYAPTPGMKSYRDQLVEIGATEAESIAFLTTGKIPEWKDLEAEVVGATVDEYLDSLGALRRKLFDVLDGLSDSQLSEALEVPRHWLEFVGDTTIEREELFRWLTRHEYYHLGQIISYRWIQGFDPYQS